MHAKLTEEMLQFVVVANSRQRKYGNYVESDFIKKNNFTTPENIRYYDLRKNWNRIRRHLQDGELQQILHEDFNMFTLGSQANWFYRNEYPCDHETCMWDIDIRHKGLGPAYWQYVKHAACHWLVNFSLRLANLVNTKKEWRIITSQSHSTVWDGKDILFDFNFQAMGIDAKRCFKMAAEKELPVLKYMYVHLADCNVPSKL